MGVFMDHVGIIAPRWKVWLAMLLGEREIGFDGNTVVECYVWRGKFYVTRIEHR